MSDHGPTKSPEKTTQRSAAREPRPASLHQSELHPVLKLQRVIGNRQVAHLIQTRRLTPAGRILAPQRRLTVGAPNDRYEQEAERVAQQVLNMPDADATPAIQHADVPETGKEQPVQAKPVFTSITPLVQRQAMPEEEEALAQMNPDPPHVARAEGVVADSSVERRINQSRGHGSPLPGAVRTYMEPRFGADFSDVRVHTGSESASLNRSLNAAAFALGKDIYFAAGKSPLDLHLTAHELTHVVQQTGAVQTKLQRSCPACAAGGQPCPSCQEEIDSNI